MAAKSQSRAPEGVSFNVQYEKKHEASFGGMRPGLTRAKTMTTAAFSRGVAALEGAEYVHRKLRRQPPKPPKNPALEWVPLVEEAGHEMQKEPTHAELRRAHRALALVPRAYFAHTCPVSRVYLPQSPTRRELRTASAC